ncbi:oligopeptide/dipeptide ABC transporter, ATP-binding protein [Lachnospiraceae bacterium JC7]|nr:oligopeptide/dipeptide ABC transporter, ATP-binding protein [Lachnospiraceae bacterium JC7]
METIISERKKTEPILEVSHLKKYYTYGNGFLSPKKTVIKAVDDVSLSLYPGETLAIVGESGCGKSTTAKSIIRITEPTEGTITLDGKDFGKLSGKELKAARQKIKMIFQDPYSALNPRMTVRDIIAEPIDISGSYKTQDEREQKVLEACDMVGLNRDYLDRYPHEFSGGQRQRIGIARAVIEKPDVILCDEPVSALDVSIQAKVINLLKELQDKLGVSYIFISHDLSVVRHMADRVMVMYLGHVVEEGSRDDIFNSPKHPYTRILLDSIPSIGKEMPEDEQQLIAGDLPSPENPPTGCCFHTRCPYCKEQCRSAAPSLTEVSGKPGHKAACFC